MDFDCAISSFARSVRTIRLDGRQRAEIFDVDFVAIEKSKNKNESHEIYRHLFNRILSTSSSYLKEKCKCDFQLENSQGGEFFRFAFGEIIPRIDEIGPTNQIIHFYVISFD